jgi:hypothetical protein
MTTPQDNLRVRFAKALGWKDETRKRYACTNNVVGWGYNTHLSQGDRDRKFVCLEYLLPDPTDANTVREALMGLTEVQWMHFSSKLFESQPFEMGDDSVDVITRTLKTPPSTLAEIYCEVKGS